MIQIIFFHALLKYYTRISVPDLMRKDIKKVWNRGIIRIAVLVTSLLGFIVPVFGGKPVIIMIASQAVSPVIMPLIIVFLIVLLNKKSAVGSYKNPFILNLGLGVTLLFSLFVSYSAVIGLLNFIKSF